MRIVTKYIDAVKDNIEFRVGQNAKDNFDIIDHSGPDDIWFHISQQSSCHVVATIPTEKNTIKNSSKKL
jgi:predicted ribosome quality control (RQC) complex YloA/Tae2 family protein